MKFNGCSGLAASVKRLGDRVQLTIGQMAFTLDDTESLKLANALVDSVELRSTNHRKETHP